MVHHTRGMLLSSQGVGFSGFDRPGHGSHSLHDVCINGFINLGDVRHKLLDVLILRFDFKEDPQTDAHIDIVPGEHPVERAFINEVLH